MMNLVENLQGSRLGRRFSHLIDYSSGAANFILIFTAIAMAFFLVTVPEVAWILLGILAGITLLNFPVYTWVIVAFIIASFSRLVSTLELAPSIINYFHFPLAFGAAFIASTKRNNFHVIARRVRTGVLLLLGLSVVSWLVNGGEPIRPLLFWIIIVEPFLLIYALMKSPPNQHGISHLWKLTLFVAFLQVPIGFWQAFSQGLADPVQGTFLGLGQGAGAASTVALIGVVVILSRVIFKVNRRRRNLFYIVAAVLLLLVPILADAKHVLAAFLISVLLVLMNKNLINLKIVVLGAMIFLVLSIAASYYPALQLIWNPQAAWIVTVRKLEVINIFIKYSQDAPWAWLIGFGPGNTFSYLALQAEGGIGNPESLIAQVGLSLSKITEDAINTSFATGIRSGMYYLFVERTSAAWQIWSSWSGIWGDLGCLGFGVYAWLWLLLWKTLGRSASWQEISGKVVLLFALLLGTVYRWLEEPNVMIIVATVIGATLVSMKRQR